MPLLFFSKGTVRAAQMASLDLAFDVFVFFLQPLMLLSLETPGTLSPSVKEVLKPGALGGAPVGQHVVLFQDLSGEPVCSLHKPHILAELQHRERIGKGYVASEGAEVWQTH